ncbi:unnamed protein product [Boreogadus saida]
MRSFAAKRELYPLVSGVVGGDGEMLDVISGLPRKPDRTGSEPRLTVALTAESRYMPTAPSVNGSSEPSEPESSEPETRHSA